MPGSTKGEGEGPPGTGVAANATGAPRVPPTAREVWEYKPPDVKAPTHPWLMLKTGVVPLATGTREHGPVPEYPSEWFAQIKSKPKCTVEQTPLTWDQLRNAINGGLMSLRGLHPLYVVDFLYRLSESLAVEAPRTWRSFGQTIVEEGQMFSPKDLLAVEVVEFRGTLPPNQTQEAAVPSLALAVGVALNYRLMTCSP